MEIVFDGDHIRFNRKLSELDRSVIDFVKLLKYLDIKYMIISGYISILLGRSRSTEDVDFFIEDIGKDKFVMLAEQIEKSGLWIINTSDNAKAFSMLKEGDSIRIAKRDTAIPNMEIKIKDASAWDNAIKMTVNDFELVTSRIENQIAFKLYLGSHKDVEDAVYIHELLKDKIDRNLLLRKCAELGVQDEAGKYLR